MSLESIKGLGPKTKMLLNNMDIKTTDDLIHYYPYRYNEIKRSEVSTLKAGDLIIMDGIIQNDATLFHFGHHQDRMTFTLVADRLFKVVIYNRGFLKKQLVATTKVTVMGKYDPLKGTITASNLRLGLLPPQVVIEPVYHLVKGLSSKQLQSFIKSSLTSTNEVNDYVPINYQTRYHFLDKLTSLKQVHDPTNLTLLASARQRLIYEELFIFMLRMEDLKAKSKQRVGLERAVTYDQVLSFLKTLPFTLTKDQLVAINDIYHDLTSTIRMNRLLQGDVGSGKTIVAFVALYINYLAHYQGALMAPTEILAKQHYDNMLSLFKGTKLKVALLTGSLKPKERASLLAKIKQGDYDVIIGTHALISEDVIYHNLGLVITDEQHRFGVNQRTNLMNKGYLADTLYLSATPIPRTYALTLYGDMDISSIHSMPKGHKNLVTTLVTNDQIKTVLEVMLAELKKGHQCYAVVPLIVSEDNALDVESLAADMKKAFGKYYKVGILHGAMKSSDKEQVMASFKANEIQILVTTTVIEVGVDVANATVMAIFDCDRFGLSTIHQLRGRIARNDVANYCFLITDNVKERFQILTETMDGFKISEMDFKLRGAGDLFGYRQSGDMVLALADLRRDYSLLLQARDDAKAYFKSATYEQDELLKTKIGLVSKAS